MQLFNREYLKTEFEKLDKHLPQQLDIYLIGGGAMSFHGLKAATKDIDVILRSQADMRHIKKALYEMGYSVPCIRGPYEKMQASAIFENTDKFRWDLFVNVVCNGLQLSNAMVKRSISLFSMERISVHIVSFEDIFIFKSITSRERDTEDMYTLFLQTLDFNIIRDEIIWQTENSPDSAWIAFFFTGIENLIEKYGVSHPIFEELHELAYRDQLSQMILDRLSNGQNTLEKLTTDLKVPEVETELVGLLKKGKVRKGGDGAYYRI